MRVFKLRSSRRTFFCPNKQKPHDIRSCQDPDQSLLPGHRNNLASLRRQPVDEHTNGHIVWHRTVGRSHHV